MTFVQAWLAKGPSTPLSRYTTANGFFYIAMGVTLYAWPGVAQTLMRAAPFEGGAEGLVRMLGATLAIIGYFYVFGGRTGATSFGLATVIDRAIVPLFLLPLAYTGAVDPHITVPFAILDPLLGLGAFIIWKRTLSSR